MNSIDRALFWEILDMIGAVHDSGGNPQVIVSNPSSPAPVMPGMWNERHEDCPLGEVHVMSVEDFDAKFSDNALGWGRLIGAVTE